MGEPEKEQRAFGVGYSQKSLGDGLNLRYQTIPCFTVSRDSCWSNPSSFSSSRSAYKTWNISVLRNESLQDGMADAVPKGSRARGVESQDDASSSVSKSVAFQEIGERAIDHPHAIPQHLFFGCHSLSGFLKL